MRTLLVMSLLLVAATALSPGPGYGSGAYFSPHELAKLEEYLHRIASEKITLKEKVGNLKDQSQGVLDRINQLDMMVLPTLDNSQDTQDSALDAMKDQIKTLLNSVGDMESQAVGSCAMAADQSARELHTTQDIAALKNTVDQMTADMEKIRVDLDEANSTLNQKLQDTMDASQAAISDLQSNMAQVVEFTNSRHCVQDVVTVDVDFVTASGSANFTLPPGIFDSMPSSVFCSIQGFVSKPHIHKSQGYGYGYPDERQNLAVTVDCQPSADRVEVEVFDQSRGKGNSVPHVTVQVMACSFGTQF